MIKSAEIELYFYTCVYYVIFGTKKTNKKSRCMIVRIIYYLGNLMLLEVTGTHDGLGLS